MLRGSNFLSTQQINSQRLSKDQRKAEEANQFEWFCLLHSLPNDDEIEATILEAIRDAVNVAAWLGVEAPEGLQPTSFRDVDVTDDDDEGAPDI